MAPGAARDGRGRLYQPSASGFAIGAGGASAWPPAIGRIDPMPRVRFDPVVDLGVAIGTRRWWRGTGTLAGAIAALLHVAPGIRPLPVFSPAPYVARAVPRPHMPPATALQALPSVPRVTPSDGRVRVTGTVGGSLFRALRRAGVPLPVLADYLRAIEPRLDVGMIAPADRFDLVMDHRGAGDGRLVYAGLAHGGGAIGLLRWTLDGREQWVDRAGEGETHPGFTMPVYGQLTSGFGMRFHPILGYSRMHQGVDLAAPTGTPIMAAGDGVVAIAGWQGGYGNYVRILHPGSLSTGYGHMSAFAVAPGTPVRQGTVIGYVGATGLATGPHLHFEMFRDGAAIDPASASLAVTERLPARSLPALRAAFAKLDL